MQTASEREQLESFLDNTRAGVLGLLDGLTEEQARRRSDPVSRLIQSTCLD